MRLSASHLNLILNVSKGTQRTRAAHCVGTASPAPSADRTTSSDSVSRLAPGYSTGRDGMVVGLTPGCRSLVPWMLVATWQLGRGRSACWRWVTAAPDEVTGRRGASMRGRPCSMQMLYAPWRKPIWIGSLATRTRARRLSCGARVDLPGRLLPALPFMPRRSPTSRLRSSMRRLPTAWDTSSVPGRSPGIERISRASPNSKGSVGAPVGAGLRLC